MKVGLYASMFGKSKDSFPDIESFIDLAYELRLDVIDLRSDVGFHDHTGDYLLRTKLNCLRKGLSIGYLATGGHFTGTDEELEAKVAGVRADVDNALALGAPMVRSFCGETPDDERARRREVECFQEVCDDAAGKGIAIGLQNHPCTGDGVLRLFDEVRRDNFAFILDTGQWVGSPAKNQGVGDPDVDIYHFMEQTAHLAVHVRAKFYKIDSGTEEWLDYDRIYRILDDAGFNGTLSVVFEGKDANDCDDRQVLTLAAAQLRRLTGATPT
jgi:sugar phosphate isomerase/epimerase